MIVEVGRVYRHTKSGKLYKVIALAKHSETLEDLVVYEAMYQNPVSQFWVRPYEEFTGNTIVDYASVPRFHKV